MHARPLFAILFLGTIHVAMGQSTALGRLNKAFNGQVVFALDRQDRLTADHMQDRQHIRQDVVYVEFLDADKVEWNSAERSIVLLCAEAHPQCIDKEIFKLNTVRHTGRCPIAWPGDEDLAEQVIADLREVIREGQAAAASRSGTAETKSAASRRR